MSAALPFFLGMIFGVLLAIILAAFIAGEDY